MLMYIAKEDKQTCRINSLLKSMLMEEFSRSFRNYIRRNINSGKSIHRSVFSIPCLCFENFTLLNIIYQRYSDAIPT